MSTHPNVQHPPSCICREHALPAAMRVRDARDVYLAENGFTVEAYDSPTAQGSFLGLKFAVPNPPSHRRAIRLHDLHHVATGYGTDHAGEAEISAWQARRGLGGTGMYVTGIVMANALIGLLMAPRRTIAALRGSSIGGSLFSSEVRYEQCSSSRSASSARCSRFRRTGSPALEDCRRTRLADGHDRGGSLLRE